MKITLKPLQMYEVVGENGQALGTFRIVGASWGGMVNLVQVTRPDGRGELQGSIICDDPRGGFGFGYAASAVQDVQAFKISPTLAALLAQDKAPEAKA